MSRFSLLIGGELQPGADAMEVLNPATQEVLALCPRADQAQLDKAIAAAKKAFPSWARTPQEQRRARIEAIAEDLVARSDELATQLTQEQGKPLADARNEILGAAYILRTMCGLALPTKVLAEDEREKVVEHRTPLGVVAAIIPWNYPVSILIVKIVPALLTGNTVVAKPAPTTPLTSLLIAEICNEHLPPGVMNMITDLNDLGTALTRHPDVAKISFTGSTATGKRVMAAASDSLKRVTLELGGNDAAIILDDADLETVAPQVFAGSMLNSGQVCMAIKRIYVHESQYDEMCERMQSLAERAVFGNGMDPKTQYGPLQNRTQFARVRELLDDTRRSGKLLSGQREDVAQDQKGLFIQPTIVRDIAESARLVREEQFGPVVPVLKYAGLDEALARANDSNYGLAGTIWSSDTDRAMAAAMQIDSGIVWINQHMSVRMDIPAGGAKQSGMGCELGLEGMAEFTQRHIIYAKKAAVTPR